LALLYQRLRRAQVFRPSDRGQIRAGNTILGCALLKRKVYFAFDFDDLMRNNNV
jgi:hypothetical protein